MPAPKNPNEKRCAVCREYKPIRDYILPKHRTCRKCQEERNQQAVEFDIAVKNAARQMAARPENAEARAFVNAKANLPWSMSISASPEGRKKDSRERHREIAHAKRKAKAAWCVARGLPVPEPRIGQPRLCRHCGYIKAPLLFADAYVRVCLECDGPPLRVMPVSTRAKG